MRQRLVIEKQERVYVTEYGDPPEVEWGDRDCTDREVTWKNIRFAHEKEIHNWDSEILWERENKGVLGYKSYCTSIEDFNKPQYSSARCICVPWDYDGPVLYIVVARYSEGDSFGHDEGYEEVVGVFTNEGDAIYFKQKHYNLLEKRYDSYFGKLQDIDIQGLLRQSDEML